MLDYGAKAIRDTFNAMSSGDTIYFPRGTYFITAQYLILKEVNIRGEGNLSVIDFSGANYLPLTISGSVTTTTATLSSHANSDQTDISVDDADEFSAGDWIRITSLANFNSGSAVLYGIKVESEDTLVFDNYIQSGATSGAIEMVGDCSRTMIHSNRIKCTANGPCIRLSTTDSAAAVKNISIKDNQLVIHYQGIKLEPDTESIETIEISNNQFIGGSSLAMITQICGTGVIKNLTANGNTVNGSNTGFNTRHVENAIFIGNKFVDVTNNAITINDGINAGQDIYLSQNIFINCGTDIDYGTQIATSIGHRTQRENFLHIKASDTDYIHTAEAGTGVARNVTTGLTNPDVPRLVTLTTTDNDNPSGDSEVTGSVRGYTRTETITLIAGGTASGNLPFDTVTKYTIPAGVSGSDTVACGIGDKLGLSGKIWYSRDVYKFSRQTGGQIYEDVTIPPVSAAHNTINLSQINEGDSYTVWYRGSLNYHN